jgi:hypothetical protein
LYKKSLTMLERKLSDIDKLLLALVRVGRLRLRNTPMTNYFWPL